MPESLPGIGFRDGVDGYVDYDVDQLLEGKVGKLIVRESGIVEIVIGETKYSVGQSKSNSSYQVCIKHFQ